MNIELKPIGYIKTPFNDKFGIPRQSGMVDDIISYIELNKDFNITAFKGLEEFSHIWIIWGFSKNFGKKWTPTVRPPRLGGNKRMGVFATRSPNRPNPLGLSSLKLIDIANLNGHIVLKVSGADMLNNTPIYDIKPYIPFTDSHVDANSGFTKDYLSYHLDVKIGDEEKDKIEKEHLESVLKILSLDPRPAYQKDPERIYGVSIYDYNIKFRVDENTLFVVDVENNKNKK